MIDTVAIYLQLCRGLTSLSAIFNRYHIVSGQTPQFLTST